MSEMNFYIKEQGGERRPVDFRDVSGDYDAVYSVEFHGEKVSSRLWGAVSGVEVLLLANQHRPDYNEAVLCPLPASEGGR